MLTKQDVGRRVVVRRVVGERDGRPLYSDILGELLAFTDRELLVRTSVGGTVTVPWGLVAAAKVIPPKPVRRVDIVALERAAAACWPAVETAWLGDWLLRASDGWTNRANSVLPLGPPDQPVPAAIATVTDWYAARGLTPTFAVPLPLAAALDRTLIAQGWRQTHETLVQTATIDTLAATIRPAQAADLPPVQLAARPSDGWLALALQRKGNAPAAARQVLCGGHPVFASITAPDGTLAAIGRGAYAEGWLGVALVEVAPAHRRRGLATHLLRALTTWGAEQGATQAFLQVLAENDTAIASYTKLGFATHHTYLNYRPPTATTPGTC